MRFFTALVLLALVLAGFVYSAPWLRFAPLGVSVVWAVAEIFIEARRRKRAQ